jgi:hypothetical protein
MTATTYTHLPGARRDEASGGWFVNLLERMVEAQVARVRNEVYSQLRGFNDETLKEIGFSAKDIKALRRGEIVDFPSN